MKRIIIALAVGAAALTACDSDIWELKDENKGAYIPDSGDPIATTLDKDGSFAEWIHVLNYSGTYSALNQGTDGVKFTAFVPSDEAVQSFYRSLGVSSIEELGEKYAAELVKQHIYSGDSLKLSEKFGAAVDMLVYTNVGSEDITIEIDTLSDGGFLLNGAVHVERNYLRASNGFIYLIDGLTTPLVETVYDRLAANPDYSLMLDIVCAAGYADDMNTLADTTVFAGLQQVTRRNYTLLTVGNEAFAAAGIHSVADLTSQLAARDANGLTPDSLLRLYVQYHLMDVRYTRADLEAMVGEEDTLRVWATMAPNQIMLMTKHMTEDSTVYVNINEGDIPTRFVDAGSDLRAKNGYLQEIDSWLPVYEPAQTVVVWDLADYPEVRAAVGEDYRPIEPVSSESKVSLENRGCYEVEVGPNGYANTTYSAVTYVTCKSNLKDCLYNDRVIFNMGYQGSVAMKTPTLVRGKYKVSISIAYLADQGFIRTQTSCKGGMMKISMDGENEAIVSPYTTITKTTAGVYTATLYDEIEFSETSSHTFKFVIMDPAASSNSKFCLQFDAITFTPITE